MFQIRQAVRKMNAAYSSRGSLSDPIINSYATALTSRMRGEIRSSMLSPAVGKVVGAGFALLEQNLIEYVTPELYREAENEVFSGIAAGDGAADEANRHI